jgi:hypothetical protein
LKSLSAAYQLRLYQHHEENFKSIPVNPSHFLDTHFYASPRSLQFSDNKYLAFDFDDETETVVLICELMNMDIFISEKK